MNDVMLPFPFAHHTVCIFKRFPFLRTHILEHNTIHHTATRSDVLLQICCPYGQGWHQEALKPGTHHKHSLLRGPSGESVGPREQPHCGPTVLSCTRYLTSGGTHFCIHGQNHIPRISHSTPDNHPPSKLVIVSAFRNVTPIITFTLAALTNNATTSIAISSET